MADNNQEKDDRPGMLKVYTPEFKAQVAARQPKETAKAIGTELNIDPSLVRRWYRLSIGVGVNGKRKPPSAPTPQIATRRQYPDTLKAKAVGMLKNKTAVEVGAELGIKANLIGRWKAEIKDPRAKHHKKAAAPKRGVIVTSGGRRSYDDAYKAQAAAMVIKRGMPVREVAVSLGVHDTQIREWVRQANGKPLSATRERGLRLEKLAGASNGYVPVANRNSGGVNVAACISMLKGIRTKLNMDDPIHLTAMLVLKTLEGKM